MGPQSDNRGYGLQAQVHGADGPPASMGPQSDNRGYALTLSASGSLAVGLQWVHSPITVVMNVGEPRLPGMPTLQWVHSPITVVMLQAVCIAWVIRCASMGPQSDNRGYANHWPRMRSTRRCFNGSTVR